MSERGILDGRKEGRRKAGRDYAMEKRESVHLETDVQGGWGMKLRVTSGHQDESSFSLVSSPQTCGLKAKQGVLLEAWHRYMVRE